MDFYKNLPAPVRIAVPAVLVLIFGFLLYMVALKPQKPEEVLKTQDYSVFNTAKEMLRGSMDVEESTNGSYTLTVSPDEADKARTMLAGAGVQDLSGTAKAIKCPAAPGFTATKAANQRADNCADAQKIQKRLIGIGATAALVDVSQAENDSFAGPAMTKNVAATVYLPETMKNNFPAEDVARQIAFSVNTPPERVFIGDVNGRAMFDGGKAASADSRSASGRGGASSLGCADIATATEVITKQTAVSACREERLGSQITDLLGSTSYFVLSVDVTIDSTARTVNTNKSTKGPTTAKSSQKGGGSEVLDEQSPPNTETETSVNPAGDVLREAITISLDRNHVTSEQELAVKKILSAARNIERKDPEPAVTRLAFAPGTGDAPRNENVEKLQKEIAEANQQRRPAPEIKTTMPKPLLALIAIVVIALVTAIVLLLRRTSGIAEERKRMEAAFQSDQRLFENFAQQNPDDIARDLETLFGQPSASGHG